MAAVSAKYASAITKRVYLGNILHQSVEGILILQKHQTRAKGDGISDLHPHQQGHQSVQDASQNQAQIHANRKLVLPLHEALAICSGHGRRGTLE